MICDMFWRGKLDGSRCRSFAAAVMIPSDYFAEVERVLGEAGHLTNQDGEQRKTLQAVV